MYIKAYRLSLFCTLLFFQHSLECGSCRKRGIALKDDAACSRKSLKTLCVICKQPLSQKKGALKPIVSLTCCNVSFCKDCDTNLQKKSDQHHPLGEACPIYKLEVDHYEKKFFDIQHQQFLSKSLKPLRFIDDHHVLSLRLLHSKNIPLVSSEKIDFSSVQDRFIFKKWHEYPSPEFLAVIPDDIIIEARQKFTELQHCHVRLFLAREQKTLDWSGAFFSSTNVIVLSGDILIDDTSRELKLFTLLHELAHAYQAKEEVFDDMDIAFKENHADRIACLKLGCFRCLQKIKDRRQGASIDKGYFSDNEFNTLIKYFKKRNQICDYHTHALQEQSTSP